MNQAILLKLDDWEGLYINDRLVEEGHHLNQGHERSIYFAELAQKLDFNLLEMKVADLTKRGYQLFDEFGNYLPEDINDFEGEIMFSKNP